jgi:hypothetical protein
MNLFEKQASSIALTFFLLCSATARGQVLIADNYNTTSSGTGFNLDTGVNSGINPPTTRLSGTAAANLRYMLTALTKSNTAFSITGNKLQVISAANPGRFTLSGDGVSPFDFSSLLGSPSATPSNPVVYDIAIAIANHSAGNQRCSFALAATEGDATTWDFGVQLFRTAASDTFYTIQKRIDSAASGLASDINSFITNTALGTVGSEINFLIRVTDAGAETSAFHSRVQVSIDAGATWIYDTQSDPALPNGWRLDGPGRYLLWDIAPSAGTVTYDNFSVRPVPVSAALLFPTNGATVSPGPTLTAFVSNQNTGSVNVTYFAHEPGKPFPGRDFLIAMLPDTQNYARQDSAVGNAVKEMWYSQTEWLITNRVVQNVAYVGQLGDLVQNGDVLNGGPNDTEWQIATNAMYRLEDPSRTLLSEGIPYGPSVGNHDQEPNGEEDGTTTHYNRYFGTNHFSSKSYYGGNYYTNGDSFFNLFSVSGLDFIVFSYEFGRYGSGVLGWTESVLATNQNRRIIVMTHYAGSDCGGTSCSLSPGGQAIYDELKTHSNFFLLLGGHVFNGNGDGEGSRMDTYNGGTVHTLVSDYQGRTNGGNGLMRLMYFSPSNSTVSVKTYSTWTGQYETDANSQFSFGYNMQLPTGSGVSPTAYVPVGTNTAIVPGTQSSVVWKSGQPNKTYEWYATVADSFGNTYRTAPQVFITTSNAAPFASNQTVTVTGDQPSQLALIGSDVDGNVLTYKTNSSPIRGLNTDFNPTNGTLVYTPARGFRGIDRFNYSVNDGFVDSATATFNLNVVAPTDTNSNGLPDAWESAFGINDPNADPDGDGQDNLAEYYANTNPTNAASAFRITNAQYLPDGHFTLNWSSVGGTRYRVQYSDDISSANFTDVVRSIDLEMDPASYGLPSTQSFTDALAPTNKARFYRVRVTP